MEKEIAIWYWPFNYSQIYDYVQVLLLYFMDQKSKYDRKGIIIGVCNKCLANILKQCNLGSSYRLIVN